MIIFRIDKLSFAEIAKRCANIFDTGPELLEKHPTLDRWQLDQLNNWSIIDISERHGSGFKMLTVKRHRHDNDWIKAAKLTLQDEFPDIEFLGTDRN